MESNGVAVEEDYEVERIVKSRIYKGRQEFLVKWKNWGDEHNEWVAREDLNCDKILKKYLKSNPKIESMTGIKKRKYIGPGEESDELPPQPDAAPVVRKTEKSTQEQDFAKKLKIFLSQFDGAWTYKRLGAGKYQINLAVDADQLKTETNARSQTTETLKEKYETFQTLLHQKCAQGNHKKIFIENNVDSEPPPSSFCFIFKCIWAKGISVDMDAVVGCKCKQFCTAQTKCCPSGMLSEFAYRNKGKLRIRPGKPIFECNKLCKCDMTCQNRTVQRGRQVELCIFRTANGRGWGVKTLEPIKKDTFVMEYVGEVITSKEADQRYLECGAEYLFDLDFVQSKPDYVVDATHMGNESHFVNHSCDPNLAVFSAFIDHLEVRLPRIALFAVKDIAKGEELTFDYAMTAVENDTASDEEDEEVSFVNHNVKKSKANHKQNVESRKRTNGQVQCLCGAENCRGFVFLDKKRDDAGPSKKK